MATSCLTYGSSPYLMLKVTSHTSPADGVPHGPLHVEETPNGATSKNQGQVQILSGNGENSRTPSHEA